jgi:hypothetical protein
METDNYISKTISEFSGGKTARSRDAAQAVRVRQRAGWPTGAEMMRRHRRRSSGEVRYFSCDCSKSARQ